jgi:ABC-type multidrug transport system ATPase subunit
MQFWDQPTRGLDSKTALQFADTLRAEADQNGRTIVATMYQAGNGIYNQFDKVLVLADGCVIYYGPVSAARGYFESLGFVCPKGANVADFLTSVTVTTERIIAAGARGKAVPNTPQEFERAYQKSLLCRQMRQTEQPVDILGAEVDALENAVQGEKKQRRVNGKRSAYTVGLRDQIVNCTIRYLQHPPLLPLLSQN